MIRVFVSDENAAGTSELERASVWQSNEKINVFFFFREMAQYRKYICSIACPDKFERRLLKFQDI